MNTDGSTATATALKLVPYIFFGGRCQEALDFYKSVFGGSYEAQTMANGPFADQTPADWKDKIMHSHFTAPGVTFMAADGRPPAKKIDPEEGNISLALTVGDVPQAEQIFKALSAGGEVKMPLEKAPWGGHFGMLVDKFGTEWMLNTEA